jgi:hypothetical protein
LSGAVIDTAMLVPAEQPWAVIAVRSEHGQRLSGHLDIGFDRDAGMAIALA